MITITVTVTGLMILFNQLGIDVRHDATRAGRCIGIHIKSALRQSWLKRSIYQTRKVSAKWYWLSCMVVARQ